MSFCKINEKVILWSCTLTTYLMKFLGKIQPSNCFAINLKRIKRFIFLWNPQEIYFSFLAKYENWQKISWIFTMCAKRRLSINNSNSVSCSNPWINKKTSNLFIFLCSCRPTHDIFSKFSFSISYSRFPTMYAIFKFCIESLF